MRRAALGVVLAASIFGLASTGAASAATLNKVGATAFGSNASSTVTIEHNDKDTTAAAGGFLLTTNPGNPGSNFVAWCLDIFTSLQLPATYNITDDPFENTSGPIAESRLDNITKLFNTGYSSAILSNGAQSAGFQLAIWELLYETEDKFDLRNGAFREESNKDARRFANQFLKNLGNVATAAYQLVFYESGKGVDKHGNPIQLSQNLVSVTPVPLPAAGLLLGAGILGLFGLKRVSKRKSATA